MELSSEWAHHGEVLGQEITRVGENVGPDLASALVGSRAALDGGEDHSLLATFPADVSLPGGFRRIGTVVAGSGVLVDGALYDALGGWDPYAGWNGGLG